MNTASKILLALAASTTLGGCAVIDGVRGDAGKKNNTPTIGNRVDILGTERDTEADPALAGVSVILSEATTNADWPQPGGNAAKSPGHVTLGQSLTSAWTANIAGATPRARLAASPVISGGRLYVIDTDARVSAFDAASGAKLWSTLIDVEGDGRPSLFGGGVSAGDNMVVATNGVGDVAGLQADTGALVWKKATGRPPSLICERHTGTQLLANAKT